RRSSTSDDRFHQGNADDRPGATVLLRDLPALGALGLEERLYLVEPALGAWVVAPGVLLADGFEFLKQLALAPGEVDWRFHHDVTEQVAGRRTAHALDALAAQAESLAALGLVRHLDARAAFERRDLDLTAERRRGERHRHFAMQVVMVALEHRVRLEVHLHI